VPGDYPVQAGYYFKSWPDPGNYVTILRLSTIYNAVKRKVGICLAIVFDARRCGVTIIAHLVLRRGRVMAIY